MVAPQLFGFEHHLPDAGKIASFGDFM